MLNFNVPEKDLGLVSPLHFVYDFSRKMYIIYYELTKFYCLIAFTSGDSRQYVLELFINQTVTS